MPRKLHLVKGRLTALSKNKSITWFLVSSGWTSGLFISSRASSKVATMYKMMASDHGGTPSSLMRFLRIDHNSSAIISACWWDTVTSLSCFFKSSGEKGHCHPGKYHFHLDRNSSWCESTALYNSAEPLEAFTYGEKNCVSIILTFFLHIACKIIYWCCNKECVQKSNFKYPSKFFYWSPYKEIT